MRRGFPIFVRSDGRAGELRIALDLEQAPDDEIAGFIDEALQAFLNFLSMGGGCGDRNDPARSSLWASSRNVSGRYFVYTIETRPHDPAILSVLLNILHWVHARLAHIERGEIVGLSSVEDGAFPPVWPALPYVVEEADDIIDEFVVELSFAREAAANEQEKLFELFACWLLVSHRGGFAPPDMPPQESAIYLGSDIIDLAAHESTFYLEIMRCDADAALDAFLNMLSWYSANVCPIKKVSLD